MENSRNIVGLVNFIMIMDGTGKRLYSRYFLPNTHYLFDINHQRELEKKIALTVNNLGVGKNFESNNNKDFNF